VYDDEHSTAVEKDAEAPELVGRNDQTGSAGQAGDQAAAGADQPASATIRRAAG
jgi:hypothetical protein